MTTLNRVSYSPAFMTHLMSPKRALASAKNQGEDGWEGKGGGWWWSEIEE